MPRPQPFDQAAAEKARNRRGQLWKAMNEFVRLHGAAVVSLPGMATVRIEAPQGSDLPTKLAGLGYDVRALGIETRIGPVIETITAHSTGKPFTREQSGLATVQVLEVDLP